MKLIICHNLAQEITLIVSISTSSCIASVYYITCDNQVRLFLSNPEHSAFNEMQERAYISLYIIYLNHCSLSFSSNV